MLIRLTEATVENAGAKAAVLGRLAAAGFPVPPAFVVPVDAYRAFTADLDLPAVLAQQGDDEVRRLIEAQPFPPWLLDELATALAELGPVAVRSSATTEDTPDASAAGQHDSYLGVRGVTAVADRVRACWASLWTQRATTYRQGQAHVGGKEPAIAVIVQRHVDAEVAGVMFTDGITSTIEASWGLGESVVGGVVGPDAFVVGADGRTEYRLGLKRTRVDRVEGGATVTTDVPDDLRERVCLTEEQLLEVNRLGQGVVSCLGSPQDIEFALESTRLWLLQSRPITAPLPATQLSVQANVLQGVGGSAGVVSGVARVVEGPGDFGRVGVGEILVCRFTDPAWTPLFGVVAGVVTETGGRLSHAAIVARERRIPAVLGVPAVMQLVRDGQRITVDGSAGAVRLVAG